MANQFSRNLKLARQARGYTQKQVAEQLGVSVSSYSLYESGHREPNLENIEKLAHIFYISINELFGLYDFGAENLIRESVAKYHTRPTCSWEEYYQLPDGEHAELINGELVYLCAPYRFHQQLVNELAYTFTAHIKKNKGPCQVYTAPFAVKLSEEEHTIVLPDISVVCDASKLDKRGCNGCPDLVVEIVSEAYRHRDYVEKLALYIRYEAREYWIVDPDKETVVVFPLEQTDAAPHTYSFKDSIPVGIFEGLSINIQGLLEG